MSEALHYTFHCPKCGCATFEEILTNVTQSTAFRRVSCEDGIVEPDYQNSATEGGEINRYQCQSCGFVLRTEQGNTINDPQALRQWMEKYGQQHHEDDAE